MTPSAFTPAMGERLVTLLAQFHLTTMATELLPRFAQAGQQETLPLLLEVCELEAAERQARRIARLRAAAKLPPGKTFATFDEKRLPRPLVGSRCAEKRARDVPARQGVVEPSRPIGARRRGPRQDEQEARQDAEDVRSPDGRERPRRHGAMIVGSRS